MKIEDLKVGDELVCVDREHYKNKTENHYFSKQNNRLIIKKIVNDGIWFESEHLITGKDLKYFKKKEQPTFNDLIDAIGQAVKDNVLFGFEDFYHSVKIFVPHKDNISLEKNDFKGSIEIIKSLYKETFVIESMEDVCHKLDPDKATIVLKNGETLILRDLKSLCMPANLFYKIFKGATVEQDRNGSR